MGKELIIRIEWEQLIHEVLVVTRRFPKSVRFTFAQRIDNLVLDIAEELVVAQFAVQLEQAICLRNIQRCIARLRLLLRLSADEGFLSLGALKQCVATIDAIGVRLRRWQETLP